MVDEITALFNVKINDPNDEVSEAQLTSEEAKTWYRSCFFKWNNTQYGSREELQLQILRDEQAAQAAKLAKEKGEPGEAYQYKKVDTTKTASGKPVPLDLSPDAFAKLFPEGS